MSPAITTVVPAAWTETTSEPSLIAAYLRLGARTSTVKVPRTAEVPTGGEDAGVPAAAASFSRLSSAEVPVCAGCQIEPIATDSTRRNSPPMWSACPCETTRRSIRRTPKSASKIRSRVGSGPPSTRMVSPRGPRNSVASPCPTSRKWAVAIRGRRGGSRAIAVATATTTKATGRIDRKRIDTARSPKDGSTQPAVNWGRSDVRRATMRTKPASPVPAATGGSHPMTAPAPPIIVAAATIGVARRFATGESRGTEPNQTSSSGATASCAETVAPSTVQSTAGRRPLHNGAPQMIPAVAAADSAKPTSPARPGATPSESATAPPSAVHGVMGRPVRLATSTSPAITAARTTDGSHRVRTTNTTRPASPKRARRLGPYARGPPTNHHAPRNSATLLPDTATKCDKPEARSAIASESGSMRTSPIRNPKSSAPAGCREASSSDPRMRRRRRLPTASTGLAASRRRLMSWALITPPTGRPRYTSSRGSMFPVAMMYSPATASLAPARSNTGPSQADQPPPCRTTMGRTSIAVSSRNRWGSVTATAAIPTSPAGTGAAATAVPRAASRLAAVMPATKQDATISVAPRLLAPNARATAAAVQRPPE